MTNSIKNTISESEFDDMKKLFATETKRKIFHLSLAQIVDTRDLIALKEDPNIGKIEEEIKTLKEKLALCTKEHDALKGKQNRDLKKKKALEGMGYDFSIKKCQALIAENKKKIEDTHNELLARAQSIEDSFAFLSACEDLDREKPIEVPAFYLKDGTKYETANGNIKYDHLGNPVLYVEQEKK